MSEQGPVSNNAEEKLTVEELGQLTRDIVLGHPTDVVLDNPTKLRTFESLRAEIKLAKERGFMIETPE
jgi:hypothetical protein